MGLQGILSARQLKKKWDNMKDKYKVLKNPPEGMENLTKPASWRWFHLMDEAMSGHLVGTANIVQPSLVDEDEEVTAALPSSPNSGRCIFVNSGTLDGVGTMEQNGIEPGNRRGSPAEAVGAGGRMRSPECQPAMNKSQTAVLYATLLPDCPTTIAGNIETSKSSSSSSRDFVREAAEVDRNLADLQKERQALEREQSEFDRELISLERDRELLSRDMDMLEQDRAAVERDRAAVERDRAAVERDRVLLDRDRAFLDRDRAFLDRDRVCLERAREDLERERALFRTERESDAEMTSQKEVTLQTRFYQSLIAADVDQDQQETRQRLVSLFQKLVEKL
ncbi:caldesmon-like isoform X2 [Channa argus]